MGKIPFVSTRFVPVLYPALLKQLSVEEDLSIPPQKQTVVRSVLQIHATIQAENAYYCLS